MQICSLALQWRLNATEASQRSARHIIEYYSVAAIAQFSLIQEKKHLDTFLLAKYTQVDN